jgi:hypothetical protein
MSETDKLKTGDVAKIAEGPGRTKAQAASRFNRWREAGIIPAHEQVWGPGGNAYVYPQSAGAIFAVLCELYDSGIVVISRDLRDMWDYLADPHAEGCQPHITHVLDAVANGEACWLILTLWRHQSTGQFQKTCCTRFEDEADKPIKGPSPDHDPMGDYIVPFHRLLPQFANGVTNVRALKAVH